MKTILAATALAACVLSGAVSAQPALQCDFTRVQADKPPFTLTFELTPGADGLVNVSTSMHGVTGPLGRFKMSSTALAYRFDEGDSIHEIIVVNRVSGAVKFQQQLKGESAQQHIGDGVCRAINITPKM